MAQFDNVTYTHYSSVLGRAVIPTEEDFNALKLVNIQTMKGLLPYVIENEENGIDSAVCMMIEANYKYNQLVTGATPEAIASESLGGHSISYGSAALNKAVELDAKSLSAKKIEAIKLFCSLDIGVK